MSKHILGKVQISTRCNQECLFCSVPRGPEENPSFEEIKERIRELKKQGTTDLFITGGEPTIHPRFFDILEYGKEQDFDMVSIQTNGSNLTKEVLEKINTVKNVRLNVSIHSHDEDTANKLSNSKHFRQFVDGMKRVDEMKISAFFTIVINSFNYRTLKDLIMFIEKNFPSIRHFSFNYIDPTGIATEHSYVVPRLKDANEYMQDTMKYIVDNGMTFRLERVPLCYMKNFEEFSTEARMRAFQEKRMTYFAYENKSKNEHLLIEEDTKYVKTMACKDCSLESLCSGLNPNYVNLHGTSEINTPSTSSYEEVVRKIRASKGLPEKKIDLFRRKVVDDLNYFRQFTVLPTKVLSPKSPRFNRLKFIEEEFEKKGQISRKDYKNRFGKDLLSEFPYAARALKMLGYVDFEGENVHFNTDKPAALYFFAGINELKSAQSL